MTTDAITTEFTEPKTWDFLGGLGG